MVKNKELNTTHEKLDAIVEKVSYMSGVLDTKLPMMATKSDVFKAITEHEKKCSKESKGGDNESKKGKVILAVSTILSVVGATIYGLIKFIG